MSLFDPNEAEHMQIKNTIMDAFGEAYFDNMQKEKALHWIMHEDPRTVLNTKETGQAPKLLQIFLLAFFCFQTSAQGPWTCCNPPLDAQSDTCYFADRSHLREQIDTQWLSAAHECQWIGVPCEGRSRTVTELDICESIGCSWTLNASCYQHPRNLIFSLYLLPVQSRTT